MPKIMNCDNPVRRYFKYYAEGENANKSICKIQNCNKILAVSFNKITYIYKSITSTKSLKIYKLYLTTFYEGFF